MSDETTDQAPSPVLDVPFEMSATIGKLAEALSKAQGEIDNAKKTSSNPFFKSKYADLAACISTIKEPLAKHNLAVVQLPFFQGGAVGVRTVLSHSSGEWIASVLKLKPSKYDPQATGSAITYARRYSLCAMVGIAQEDDDGNSISAKGKR